MPCKELCQLFCFENGNYFIKDKLLISSIYNKRKKTIKTEIKKLCNGIDNEEAESINKFLGYYSKPNSREISSYEGNNHKIKLVFIHNAKIRKLSVNNEVGLDLDARLRASSCTCVDYLAMRICQHLLAVLVNEGYFQPDITLKTRKKPGRKKKVSPALERD